MGQKPISQNVAASNRMKANKGKNTRLEVRFRKELWARRIRGYRVNVSDLPGKPDIVFPKKKLAIFIHGCFWHSCPKCNRSNPKHNNEFWANKFRANKVRDAVVEVRLLQSSWKVIIIWECEIKRDLNLSIERIAQSMAMN